MATGWICEQGGGNLYEAYISTVYSVQTNWLPYKYNTHKHQFTYSSLSHPYVS